MPRMRMSSRFSRSALVPGDHLEAGGGSRRGGLGRQLAERADDLVARPMSAGAGCSRGARADCSRSDARQAMLSRRTPPHLNRSKLKMLRSWGSGRGIRPQMALPSLALV